MNLTAYLLLTILLIGAEWLYLRTARQFGWFDKPNQRSLHSDGTTVRGGGFVFYLAVLGAVWLGHLDLLYVCLGLTIITFISFWDDLYSVPKHYRIAVHIIAIVLLLIQGSPFSAHWWLFAGLLGMGIGIVNAYNFMDGINGMTALYSLVTVGSFWYWQAQLPGGAICVYPCVFIALLIFSYVNARQRAICFAGDVGSVSMGFIVLYGLVEGVNRSHTYLPILFLSVYGVDTLLTIVHRLHFGQNILQAHRMHLFQLLVHQLGWSHLRVAALYAVLQAVINGLVIVALNWSPVSQVVLVVLILGGLIIAYETARKQIDKAIKKESAFPPTPPY